MVEVDFGLVVINPLASATSTNEGGRSGNQITKRCQVPNAVNGMLPIIKLVNVEDTQIREGIRALLAVWAQELEVVEALQTSSSARSSIFRRAEVWTSRLGHSWPWINAPQGFSRRASQSVGSSYNFQLSEYLLRQRLIQIENTWRPCYESPERREQALNEFFRYSYQWY
jgi:hypothetical protein